MDLKKSFYPSVVRFLVLIMVVHGMPLQQLCQAYKWNPTKLYKLLDTAVSLIGPAEAQAAIYEGDFDDDGDVDGFDLATFSEDFGRTDCDIPPPCEGDFNNDNRVDQDDLATFSDEFGEVELPRILNKLVSITDIQVPARGIPIQIVRTYLLDSDFNGPMGYGWTHTYRMRAVEMPSGEVQIFNADGTASIFTPNGGGMYQSPKGDYRTLAKSSASGVYTLTGKYGTRYYFSANGKLFRQEDRNGNAVKLLYDSTDTLVEIQDATGRSTTFTYDANKRITAITDPAGRSVTYSYDGAGDLVAVTDFGGNTTFYAYDGQHNLTTITDPLGNRTFFLVDAEDRLQGISGENNNNKLTIQYSVPLPDDVTITDALDNATVLTLNYNGQITRVVDPLSNSYRMFYDENLNLTSIINANEEQSFFSYDNRGNLISAEDAAGNVVSLTYHPVYNLVTSITDERGKTTEYSYDDTSGNLVLSTYPDDSTEIFSYDSFGYLDTKTDRKSQTITFSYNSVGQLAGRFFPDGTSDTFEYDAAGNLITATDENGTISLVYDPPDKIKQVTYPGGEIVSYEYDANGNRTRTTYPDGTVLDYQYDQLNRMTGIESGGTAIASYTYDLISRVKRRELQNGTYTTYNYDESNRLLSLINKKSTDAVISSFIYTYDSLGNRESMTTLGGTTNYVYDAINQLTNVVEPGGITTDYEYDPAGNRISVTENGAMITSYATNDLNQYTDAGGKTYTYDGNGNLKTVTTTEGVTTFSYDFQNHLIQITTPAETINYAYDPFGRRISKTTAMGTTNFIHDGGNVIMEKDDAGTVQAKYIHGLRIDEILFMERDGEGYFYCHDGLGSVVDLTDLSENLVASFSYDAYGKPSGISSVGNPYLYTGRYYEPETGLYFYRARYYDPVLGRFLNPDPIGFRGGINLYSYVENNPINFVDPKGKSVLVVVGCVSGLVI